MKNQKPSITKLDDAKWESVKIDPDLLGKIKGGEDAKDIIFLEDSDNYSGGKPPPDK